jgi:class 3 adenylate cyclase
MFTDIVGSTQLKSKMPGAVSSEREAAFLKLIKQPHDVIIAQGVAARGGFIVKSTGDGFLIAFSDPQKAVLCGVEIQEKLKGATIPTPDGPLQIRIGLNSGPAEPNDGDYGASAVDKANRVESSAANGQVFLSSETHALVKDKVRTISTYSAGTFEMKGVGDEELFVAIRSSNAGSRQDQPFRPQSKRDVSAQPPDLLSKALRQHQPDLIQPKRNSGIVQPPDVVVIGDPDDERFKWFKKLLRDVYEVGAVQAKTFEQVKKLVEDKSADLTDTIVFLCDDLPFSASKSTPDPNLNFVRLEQIARYTDFVCIVTKEHDPNLAGVDRRPHHVHLRSLPPTEKDRKTVLTELGSLGDRLARLMDLSEIAKITEWNKADRTLHRQIRSLSEAHKVADGEVILLRLIRKSLDCYSVAKIEIKRLGQGRSGTIVFQLVITNSDQTNEYVLKLSDEFWKLQSEVSGHLEAQKGTNLTDYQQHVAALRKPIISIKSSDPEDHFKDQFIVNSGRWYAIHCDLLGHSPFNRFIDLETALTAAPATLQERTKNMLPTYHLISNEPDKVLAHRLKIFSSILDGLCELWYGKKRPGSHTSQPVWQMEDAEDERVIPLPPYQLTRRVKSFVQNFLDCREAAIGLRLFPSWKDRVTQVLKLVSDESTAAELGLGGKIPFTLSPVHGDLYANNVLLWLEHERYAFVIDLPSYQSDGHTLQDFARLEVEIKYVLLDRQVESPADQVAAYDYTQSQVQLWIQMEDQLMGRWALDESKLGSTRVRRISWKKGGYSNNVELCYRLVMILRQRACAIQQKRLDDEPTAIPFADEYLPALLYQSVLAIADPSLSLFKRLLALYSAGSILKRCTDKSGVHRPGK